jgi:hypothetical protein
LGPSEQRTPRRVRGIQAAGGHVGGRRRRSRRDGAIPTAAAASLMLGFHEGSAPGPEETSGRGRGRAGTDVAGESSGEAQPSRSAGAHLVPAQLVPAGRPPGQPVPMEHHGSASQAWPVGIAGALWIGDEEAEARFESMELQAEDGGVGPTCCGKDRGWSR